MAAFAAMFMDVLAALCTPENLIALATLTSLEIVLGIDNLVFLTILAGKLPEAQRPRARFIGLFGAMFARVALLFGITWVMGLTRDLFSVSGHGISGKDIILILGGLFLIAKATHEIHGKLENDGDGSAPTSATKGGFIAVIVQIILIDIVFSLDSVITAVGMVDPVGAAAAASDAAAAEVVRTAKVSIMVIAVVLAIIVMMVFAGRLGAFVERHPTIKILALSFLILIGVMLVAEGFDQHIPKGYIYFAMAFSLTIEVLNMRLRRNKPMVGGITGRPQPGQTPPDQG